jgi:ABC-2 type transport system permease protein
MKAWTIAWKDTLIRLRDRTALIINLGAPLALAAIMGFAFGGQSDGSNPITDIPVIVVNEDSGDLGDNIFTILSTADGLDELLAPTEMESLEEAIAVVEDGNARGVIYIPPGFSNAIAPENGIETGDPATVQLFTDPAASISPVILSGVLEQILIDFNQASLSGSVAVDQLTTEHFAELGPQLAQLGTVIPEVLGENAGSSPVPTISINQIVDTGDEEEPLNVLLFFAPSMAIFFLMFSMMEGSRGILDEKLAGTLDRLMATPTSAMQIVLGKIGGTFLIGILQMAVLIIASSVLFQISWGTTVLGVVLVTVGVVAASTSLGTLIAAFATQPNQVQIVGTAISLIFAMLGGNFIQAELLPDWLQPISKLTLNRWAIDGFTDLTIGRVGVAGILPEAGVLFGMAILFFGLGVWQFQKRLKR